MCNLGQFTMLGDCVVPANPAKRWKPICARFASAMVRFDHEGCASIGVEAVLG